MTNVMFLPSSEWVLAMSRCRTHMLAEAGMAVVATSAMVAMMVFI
jgi:hypothetical protein